jgi:hypothetical protein
LEILLESGSLDTLIEGLTKFSERYFERIHNQTKTSVTVKWTKEFGPVYLFRKIWGNLGLGRLLKKLMDDAEIASQYDEAILAMVLNRLMDSGSQYRIFKRWVDTIYAERLSEIQFQHYYRAWTSWRKEKKCSYMGI